uniref:Uncharacterized protein n=1 Tax=Panagrolaimus sp. ES5 TaxID=591445 RepID=A0AC34FKM0_9BILA
MIHKNWHVLFIFLLLITGPQIMEINAGPILCATCLAACGAAIAIGSIATAATAGAASPFFLLVSQHCPMCVAACFAPTP